MCGREGGEWAQAPLREIARHLFDDCLDELTTAAVARVYADEPQYAGSMVSQDDLKRSMRRTLGLALLRLLGEPIPEDLSTATYEIGRRRAEQGLPLSALLHSYRIDLRILWEAIIAEGVARGFAGDKAFLESCVLVWEAVEANVSEVVDAYRRTEEDVTRHLDVMRGRAFEKLVLTGDHDPSSVEEAASCLQIPAQARYLVVVGEEVSTSHETLVTAMARLRARGLSSYFAWIGDNLVGIVLLAGKPAIDAIAFLDPLASWRWGAAVTESLSGVTRATRLAHIVMRSVSGAGIHLLSANWTAALLGANKELAEVLANEVLGPLLALPPHEQAAVFETLDAYASGAGSVAEVASLTLRHRNTVRNRLATVERATGLSLSRPKDMVALTLALEWRRVSRASGQRESPGLLR